MPEETTLTPIEARLQEVAQYDANIVMYETIIASLPDVWPDHLAKFKGRKDHQQAVTEVDAVDVEVLSKLLFREQCENAISAEKLERIKAATILAVLQAQAE